MPDGPVVSNNTPLVALQALERLDLLRDLFERVLIPEAVRDEFLATDTDLRRKVLESAPWVETRSLRDPRRTLPFAGLDLGEAEVLVLAEERKASLLLLDERKARRFARRMGHRVTGTVGILLLAKERGLLANVAEPLMALAAAGLHLGAGVVEEALRLAGETEV